MKILGLKQGTLPSYTWAPHSFWDTQRNPRALKNKTKYYWADWFLRSLWASMKPIIPRVQKKALKNTLRFGEFRKPASQRPSKKLSCGKYSWWIWEVIFFFLPENAVGAEKKKAILNKLYNRKRGVFQMLNVSSRCISHSSEFTNSHHSLNPGNEREIFLPRFFQLKLRVKERWLSLPSGKYSDLWRKAGNYCILSQSFTFQCIFSWDFLILKDTFLFPSELEWLWSFV